MLSKALLFLVSDFGMDLFVSVGIHHVAPHHNLCRGSARSDLFCERLDHIILLDCLFMLLEYMVACKGVGWIGQYGVFVRDLMPTCGAVDMCGVVGSVETYTQYMYT